MRLIWDIRTIVYFCFYKQQNSCRSCLIWRIVRKPDFCLYENKGTDQLHSNCEADQHLCFHYTDSTMPLLPKSESSSFWTSSVGAQVGSCQTWSENPKTGFLMTLLIWRYTFCQCFFIPKNRMPCLSDLL